GEAAATVATVTAQGFPITIDAMQQQAELIGEKTLFGRTGGAATLAVGMAHIFSGVVGNRGIDLWYHFAIMFEALFILTTIDAGTRVGRYLLQDLLGHLWKPLGETRDLRSNLITSVLLVAGWGYFLVQGVLDPLGGINSLWPLFGIANQLLAAIALCLATTVILKMQLAPGNGPAAKPARPAFAFVTLVPLVWLLAVTMTAGVQKIFHPSPGIGFLAQANALKQQTGALEQALQAAQATGNPTAVSAAQKALQANATLIFNNFLDAAVAGILLVFVIMIVFLSVREWILLIARRRKAVLHETEPVWLPDYALAEGKPLHILGLFALAFALAKELSGEAALERARQPAALCACDQAGHEHQGNLIRADSIAATPDAALRSDGELYAQMTERRFNGVTRCC
ncbi:MAG: carbon starvation protein A, partial [Pedosphaera parvula]|nr:carbon starvation protein A [Pedosphaera parvula]